MSDQLVVEREGLEKKDKSELQAIVSALGGTAGSRARKSDLIDQILELSGATARSSQSDEADEADEAEASDDGAEAADSSSDSGDDDTSEASADVGEADAASDQADDSTDGADAGSATKTDEVDDDHPTGPDGEPLSDWEIQVLEEGGQPPAKGSRRSRGKARQGNDRQGNDRQQGERSGGRRGGKGANGQGAESRDGEARGDRNDGGGRSGEGRSNRKKSDDGDAEAKGNERSGDGGTNDGDEVDPSNRRSRRRNRNRNRDDAGNDAVSNDPIEVQGFLDLRDEGYAFLRVNGFLPSRDDAYVSVKQVRTYGLRKGDHVTGLSRPASRNEKNPALQQLSTINGKTPEETKGRPRFERLTPLFPDERLVLERPDEPLEMTTRIIDLVSPIGKGQRGLIVSPPKAGKTAIMKQIARSIEVNNPEVELVVLLIDERPEEVTDMERHLQRGEVVASTFDRPAEEHTAIAELTLERAKRLVEAGHDVCLIIDGITRLARAYNMSAPQSGRVLSGGVDAAALYPPKRFLGAARNLEEGGSLTMLATALVETGSRMDEVIFEEFKGTGNMELRLDRRLAEKRIFPAIDIDGSSTRNEELLRDRKQVEASWKLRKVVSGMNDDAGGSSAAGIEMLVERLKSFKTNAEFLAEVAKTRA